MGSRDAITKRINSESNLLNIARDTFIKKMDNVTRETLNLEVESTLTRSDRISSQILCFSEGYFAI